MAASDPGPVARPDAQPAPLVDVAARPDPAAVVGDAVVLRSLRRDRLGEVCVASRRGQTVRLRLCVPGDGPALAALARRLQLLAALRDPAVAPVLDRLADTDMRAAVITPVDHTTLEDRRRRGPLDTPTAVALGAVLIDGLRGLHGRGLHHGAAGPAAVGVDATGRPWWQDAALAPPPADGGEGADMARLAATLRDAGGLPPSLEQLADDIASGQRGTPGTLEALAHAWSRLAAQEGLALPPPGVRVALPGLLAAPPRTPRARRMRSPRWSRPALATLLGVCGVLLVPVARAAPGGAAAAADLGSYRPSRVGQHLAYNVTQRTRLGTHTIGVSLTVQDLATVAGVPTVTLVPAGTASGAALPLGLGGATLRIQDGAMGRSIPGGAVATWCPHWHRGRRGATGMAHRAASQRWSAAPWPARCRSTNPPVTSTAAWWWSSTSPPRRRPPGARASRRAGRCGCAPASASPAPCSPARTRRTSSTCSARADQRTGRSIAAPGIQFPCGGGLAAAFRGAAAAPRGCRGHSHQMDGCDARAART